MSPLFLIALLAIQAPAYQCRVDDSTCWMSAALSQQERAERSEGRAQLLEEAVSIGRRLLADANARGDRWQNVAEKVAPKTPAVWERPEFWLVTGFVAGAATAVAITFAVNRAH